MVNVIKSMVNSNFTLFLVCSFLLQRCFFSAFSFILLLPSPHSGKEAKLDKDNLFMKNVD